jgi:hypothetical protein
LLETAKPATDTSKLEAQYPSTKVMCRLGTYSCGPLKEKRQGSKESRNTNGCHGGIATFGGLVNTAQALNVYTCAPGLPPCAKAMSKTAQQAQQNKNSTANCPKVILSMHSISTATRLCHS